MKKIITLIIPLLLLVACDKNPEVFPVSLKQQEVINSGNVFGFDLFRKINETEIAAKNLFISPLSISMALGMTLNGANANTLDEMKAAMYFSSLTNDEINKTYRYLLDNLISLDPKVVMEIANSIWYRNTFNVLPDFLTTNQTYFDAEVSPLDFDDPASKDVINKWVSDNTNSKIKTIIDEITPEMVMYLINAVYFKGQWKYQFDKSDTYEAEFEKSDGSKKSVSMMKLESDINFLSNELFRAVELPYGKGNYSMIVMVPKDNYDVNDIIEELNEDNWNSWMDAMAESEDAKIHLPKFKFEYEIKLNDALQALGMSDAFQPGIADFTRINSDGGLYISEVKHKTFVEVNEEGTEAAAVTSVGIGYTSMPDNYLIANKPFLFVIKEKNTKAVIFIGKIMEPVF